MIPYKSSWGRGGQREGREGKVKEGRRTSRGGIGKGSGADCSKLLLFHSSRSELPTRHWKATDMSGTLDSIVEDNQMEAV